MRSATSEPSPRQLIEHLIDFRRRGEFTAIGLRDTFVDFFDLPAVQVDVLRHGVFDQVAAVTIQVMRRACPGIRRIRCQAGKLR